MLVPNSFSKNINRLVTFIPKILPIIFSNAYLSPARLANFGAITPEKLICFSGGGAPTDPLMMTLSPERT